VSTRDLARRAARIVIARKMISAEEVHRYGIRARDLSQSNGVALVEAGNGRGYAAKDMRQTRTDDQGSPGRELALYRAIAGRDDLQPFAPAFHAYDEDEEVMLLEGLLSYRRLDQLSGGKLTLDAEVAGWLGEALGGWHLAAASLAGLQPSNPWLFDIDGDERMAILDSDPRLREVTGKILACDDLRSLLSEARSQWSASTVIHGDVRFANVMIHRSPPAVRFIDWETSGRGDPAWDVAGAVQEYLSVGISGGNPIERSPAAEPVVAMLDAYERASRGPMPWTRLAPFVACRLLVRAIQLANWEGDVDEAIDEHLALARVLGRSKAAPFASRSKP